MTSVELHLLIIAVVLLEWVFGQMIFVSWFLTANTFIHSSVQNLTSSLFTTSATD